MTDDNFTKEAADEGVLAILAQAAIITAERDLYRAALNCETCKGWHRRLNDRIVYKPSGDAELEEYWEECPSCREAREKARSNEHSIDR